MKKSIWATIIGVVALIAYGQASPKASRNTTFLSSCEVAAAFAKGRPLLEQSAFKVHASRRDNAGTAEIHTRDTDIIYVLDGGATLVTGGTAVGTSTIGPDEIRGTAIKGGETHRLTKGDVIVIPNGVPHWFKEVEAPLVYYVVKVTNQITR
jgi:glc operon protein GlcG